MLAALFCAPALADDTTEKESAVESSVFTVQGLNDSDLNWYRGYASKISDTSDSFTLTAPVETDNFGVTWKGSGRWGLTLDVTRRSESPVPVLPQEEIDAGAYFQVTPRLRLGGGIRFRGDDVTSANRWAETDDRETDVRIGSAFSF